MSTTHDEIPALGVPVFESGRLVGVDTPTGRRPIRGARALTGNETLAALGMTKRQRPEAGCVFDILRGERVLYTGTAGAVRDWLRAEWLGGEDA